jgi:hypothetical protein
MNQELLASYFAGSPVLAGVAVRERAEYAADTVRFAATAQARFA